MDDANDNDPLFLPLRFPFVDPTDNIGPDDVPFKVPRDFGFRQPFRLYGRRFTEDLDQRNREESASYKDIHAFVHADERKRLFLDELVACADAFGICDGSTINHLDEKTVGQVFDAFDLVKHVKKSPLRAAAAQVRARQVADKQAKDAALKKQLEAQEARIKALNEQQFATGEMSKKVQKKATDWETDLELSELDEEEKMVFLTCNLVLKS